MSLTLRINKQHTPSSHRAVMPEITFVNHGGKIGRAADNEWVLPDPDRFLSSVHAIIQYEHDQYFLLDNSLNGVFVNDNATPIGKNQRVCLRDGDLLFFGDYEVNVLILSDHPISDFSHSSRQSQSHHQNKLAFSDDSIFGNWPDEDASLQQADASVFRDYTKKSQYVNHQQQQSHPEMESVEEALLKRSSVNESFSNGSQLNIDHPQQLPRHTIPEQRDEKMSGPSHKSSGQVGVDERLFNIQVKDQKTTPAFQNKQRYTDLDGFQNATKNEINVTQTMLTAMIENIMAVVLNKLDPENVEKNFIDLMEKEKWNQYKRYFESYKNVVKQDHSEVLDKEITVLIEQRLHQINQKRRD